MCIYHRRVSHIKVGFCFQLGIVHRMFKIYAFSAENWGMGMAGKFQWWRYTGKLTTGVLITLVDEVINILYKQSYLF